MSSLHVSDSSTTPLLRAMTEQSGSLLGGGGRGCEVLGAGANGANSFSVGSCVDGSAVLGASANGVNIFGGEGAVGDSGGDMPMGSVENSEVNSGRGIRLSGGLGRLREEVAGGGREQGAAARSLEELMATIVQNAGQRDRQAGGWGSAWRDDVSAHLACKGAGQG